MTKSRGFNLGENPADRQRRFARSANKSFVEPIFPSPPLRDSPIALCVPTSGTIHVIRTIEIRVIKLIPQIPVQTPQPLIRPFSFDPIPITNSKPGT